MASKAIAWVNEVTDPTSQVLITQRFLTGGEPAWYWNNGAWKIDLDGNAYSAAQALTVQLSHLHDLLPIGATLTGWTTSYEMFQYNEASEQLTFITMLRSVGMGIIDPYPDPDTYLLLTSEEYTQDGIRVVGNAAGFFSGWEVPLKASNSTDLACLIAAASSSAMYVIYIKNLVTTLYYTEAVTVVNSGNIPTTVPPGPLERIGGYIPATLRRS